MSSDDERDANQRALLRAQPWGQLLKQLTGIALKRIRGRSLADANDLAQSAIADAYRSVTDGGWDPERGPLRGYLVSRVIGTSSAERRRKRNTCEVWLDEEDAEDEGQDDVGSRYEKHMAADAPTAEETLHGLRFAKTFEDRLQARIAGDPLALQIIPLMKDGVATPRDLASATGRSSAEITEARRRLRYHANEITKELSATAGTSVSGARSNEVTQ